MKGHVIRLAILAILVVSLICGALVSAESTVNESTGTTLQPTDASMSPVRGHAVWTYTTGSAVSSSPAIIGGIVYVGSEDGNLYAINADSGTLVWKYQTGSYISSSPKVSDGIVYVGGGDRVLYAISTGTGTPVWTYQTGSGISSSPAIADGVVYAGSEDGTIYAISADSGTLLWSAKTGNFLHSSPVVSEGTLYFGSYDHNVYAINATTGTRVWNYTSGNTILSSPAVADGFVYIGSYDRNVYALDAGSGAVVWKFTTGNTVLSSPTVAGGRVYIGSSDGNIYARDAVTGSALWTYTTGNKVDSTPFVADGIVYAGNAGGNFYAINATNGRLIWDYPVGTALYSSPAVSGEIVCIGSNDNKLYALSNRPPVADFTTDVTSGLTPLAVRFTDTSTGSPTAWSWDFGDGDSTNATVQNPVHTYLTNGTFTVSLTVTNGGGSAGRVREGYLTTTTILPPAPVANFTVDTTLGIAPLTVQFIDQSTGSISSGLWDFGDGNTSMQVSPRYTYLKPGNYTVTLTVKNPGGNSTKVFPTPVTVRANAVMPDPDFSVNTTSGLPPLAVRFNDTSAGPEIYAWTWDFNNDGIIDSTEQNATCIYKLPGNYTVNLTVTNPFGTKTISRNNTVIVGSLAPVVAFTANNMTGLPPLAVQFNDTSSGSDITGWAWDFNNDGTIDSTDKSPVCIYKLAGNYTVNLTVTNAFGSNGSSQADFIRVGTLAPIVAFSAANVTGIPPLTVRFTDNSTGQEITGWAWDFNNDGTIDSTEENPTCVYKMLGNYTVNLTVTNAYGSNTSTRAGLVTVTNGVLTDFMADQTSGPAPFTVRFSDLSTGPEVTGWAWDFNDDGTIDSTEQNPTCVYKLPGNYTVNLTTTNAYGSETASRTEYIQVIRLAPAANFSANRTEGVPPFTVRFQDTTTDSNVTGWAWDFNNDGIIDSTEQNPTCVYRQYGNYTVNLTVTNSLGSAATSKEDFITVSNGIPTARFAVNRTSGTGPLAVQFKDASTGPEVTGWAWDFNDDGTLDSTEQNPTCIYKMPGSYTINLTVTNAYGSDTVLRKGFITVT
ncbi:MAG: PKD domain-containing protein [Methanoregulaceae archaeon]